MSASRSASSTRWGRGRPALAVLGLVAGLALCASVWRYGEQWVQERSARAAFPTTQGAIRVSGLSDRVEVVRDGRGVPHIEALREMDGWAALGFSHAQDRLAQMFWLRRLARGRTAEVVGERGLPSDRLARTLAIGSHADAEAGRLDPATREVLNAYVSGINSRMDRLRRGLVAPPLEIAALGDLFEPWTPADSLAVVKLIAWSAGPAPETAAVLWDLIDRLGAVAARPFLPTGLGVRGADLATTLPGPESPISGKSGSCREASDERRAPEASCGSLQRGSTRLTALADALLSSSASVVSGALTRSGSPILSVDFHLPPTVPSLIYEAGLRAGALDVIGATVPGVPVFWAGRNRTLAWAATPARIMTADLYREIPNPDNPDEHRHGRVWRAARLRTETITVAVPGQPPRTELLRVRETRHGPIVNELIGRAGDPLALAWTGAVPGNGVKGMLGVARASNELELRAALRDHHEPAIALLYTDAKGAGGLQVAGWIPQRRLATGLVPVPGRQTAFDWRGPVRFERLPHRRLEPGQKWLIASDAPLVDGLGGRIEWLWRTGEVAARLESRLQAISQSGEPLEPRDLAALRPERWSLRSPEVVKALLALAGDRESLPPEAREVADMLASWDSSIESGSRGAAAVHLVFHHLTQELFAGTVGPERLRNYLALRHSRPQAVTEAVVLAAADSAGGSGRQSGWHEPERVGGAIRQSLRAAWMSLSMRLGVAPERWRWERLADLSFRPFASAVAYGEIADPGGDGRYRGHPGYLPDPRGSGHVAAMSATDPFEVEATTSYRLVMDLGSPHHLLSALAPGQSEHPYHPHFDDGLDGRREEADVSSVGDGRWSRRSVVVRAGEAMEAREQGVAQDWADGALRLVLQPLELAP